MKINLTEKMIGGHVQFIPTGPLGASSLSGTLWSKCQKKH